MTGAQRFDVATHRRRRAARGVKNGRKPGDVASLDHGPDTNLSRALEQGIRWQQAGDLGKAAKAYQHILARAPNDPNALHLLGLVADRMGRHDTAQRLIRRVVEAHPAFAEAHHNLGNVLKAQGKLDEAVVSFRRALALASDLAAAHLGLGTVLQEQEKLDQAIMCYRRAIDADPSRVAAYNNLGSALEAKGRFDDASAAYREALAIDPTYALTYMNVVAGRRIEPGDEIVPRIASLLAREAAPPYDRMLFHYALGKCLDDIGDTDKAFHHFRLANDLQKESQTFDPGAHAAGTDRLIETFTKGFFEDRAGYGNAARRPIFIVGMPRSGTTLVEQILASHPRVRAGGERPFFGQLVNDFPSRARVADAYPAGAGGIDARTADRLAGAYLDDMGAQSRGRRRGTDKMPQNFRHLGLIALLFPRALVIHCRRHPMDVGLSCYFQNFEKLPFSTDLDTIGRFHRDYERLMAHWRDVLPLDMLDVHYEDLVAETDAVTRRILAFCALDWDSACLAFHETQRTVTTASLWQVRQPIYSTSVGRWKRYERHLAPLRTALDGAP